VTEAHHERAPRARPGRWGLFFGLAALVVAVDQLTKAWVDRSFPQASIHGPGSGLAGPAPIVGDFVRITKTYNDGGIFGLLGDAAPLLAVASLFVIGFIVLYQARAARTGPLLLTVTLGLLLGGAIGNLVDRLRYGYVIDWVDTGLGTFRWYTFNVADAAISLALVGLITLSLFGDRLERRGVPEPKDLPTKPRAADTGPAVDPAGR
jgi:signal peptidase II